MNPNSQPTIRIPKAPSLKLPKMPKMPAPKIASIHVTPIGGGIKVQHNMTHGPKPLPFVFSNPAGMKKHLARIENNEWRMPDRNVGAADVKSLGLDSGAGTSSW
jgi:hypothetical protein